MNSHILGAVLLSLVLLGIPSGATAQDVEIPVQVQGDPTAADTSQASIFLFDGELFFNDGDLPRAAGAFRDVLSVLPDHPRARLLLARTLTMALVRDLVPQGEQAAIGSEALRHFRWVLDHDPGNSEALEAVRLLAIKFVADDIQEFNSEGTRRMWEAGLRALDEGRNDDAVEAFRKVVRADPMVAGGHRRLGDALRLSGNADGARVTYQRALELNPNDFLAMTGLGLALQAGGDHEGAMTQLRAAYDLNDEEPIIAEAIIEVFGDSKLSTGDGALRGRALVTLHRWSEAETVLRPLAKEGSFRDRTALAKAVYFQGKIQEALDLYGELHRESPNDLEPLFYLGAGNIQMGRSVRGQIYLRQVLEQDPGNSNAMKVLGLSLSEDPGNEEEALALLSAVRDADAEDADRLTCAIGSLLLRLDRDEEARRELDICAQRHPDNASAHLGMGILADRAGRRGEAIVHLEQYLNLEPAQPGVLIRLGLAYLRTGREEDGFAALRRITEMEEAFRPPDGGEVTEQSLLEMASFYLGTVRAFDDAIYVGERLLAMDPDNSIYYNNLAMVYADADLESERAFTLATRANELFPENPGHMDTLGWTLLRLERYADAEREFLNAIELASAAPEPQNLSEIYYHLGVLCQLTERPEAARDWLQKALEDPPTPFLKREIEKAMGQ